MQSGRLPRRPGARRSARPSQRWTQEQVPGATPTLNPIATMTYAAAYTESLRPNSAVFVPPAHLGSPDQEPRHTGSTEPRRHGRHRLGESPIRITHLAEGTTAVGGQTGPALLANASSHQRRSDRSLLGEAGGRPGVRYRPSARLDRPSHDMTPTPGDSDGDAAPPPRRPHHPHRPRSWRRCRSCPIPTAT